MGAIGCKKLRHNLLVCESEPTPTHSYPFTQPLLLSALIELTVTIIISINLPRVSYYTLQIPKNIENTTYNTASASLRAGAGEPVQSDHTSMFWGEKLTFVVVTFFGHVLLLRFVVVKMFWSYSNLNLVIFIRSCELASLKSQIFVFFIILIWLPPSKR